MLGKEQAREAKSRRNEADKEMPGGLGAAFLIFCFLLSKVTHKGCVMETRESGSHVLVPTPTPCALEEVVCSLQESHCHHRNGMTRPN